MLVDPQGKAEKVEDVFSKVELAREHCETQECPSKRSPPPHPRDVALRTTINIGRKGA